MRALKFRGYNSKLGRWIYGSAYMDGYILDGIIEANDEYITIKEWTPVELHSVGRSLNVYDEYGIAIYENDYVRAYDSYNDREFVGQVVFKDNSFVIENETSTNYRLSDYKLVIINENKPTNLVD